MLILVTCTMNHICLRRPYEEFQDSTESYHQWSSTGSWFVFSSKRLDGLWGRPFFAYIYPDGNTSKPFILPQEDPYFYDTFLKSYNIPELIIGKIKSRQFNLTSYILGESTQADFDTNSIK